MCNMCFWLTCWSGTLVDRAQLTCEKVSGSWLIGGDYSTTLWLQTLNASFQVFDFKGDF